jgi:hypothetical protein
MRVRKPPRDDEYDWTVYTYTTPPRRHHPKKPPRQRKQRASMPSAKQTQPPRALADLYTEVPEVIRFDSEFENTLVPIDLVSDADIIDAFAKATECPDLIEDFSFESILGLGPLPHVTHEVSYRTPSPSTLSALPSFTTADLARAVGIPIEAEPAEPAEPVEPVEPPTPPPKPRFSVVKNCRSPEKVAIVLPLRSVFEFQQSRSNSDHASFFMNKEVINRINSLMSGKPKKSQIRKPRLAARQTTLDGLRQRKPVGSTVAKPEVAKPEVAKPEVVFNHMLVCAA